MNPSIYNITLDVKSIQSQLSLPMRKDFTARTICISLVDGIRPYEINEGCVAVLAGTKADSTTFSHYCVVSNNKIYYEIQEQTVSCPGMIECEVILYGANGTILATPRLTMVVDDRIIGDIPVSADDHTVFNELMLRYAAKEEEFGNAERQRNANEVARKDAETARRDAEAERVSAETARKENFVATINGLDELARSLMEGEDQRVAWEQERWEAEAKRENNENIRIANENERIANENARKDAENLRISAEKGRVTRFAGMESDMQKHLADLDSRYRLGTQEMVNKWLDEHPEATTTVVPHSLDLDHFVFGSLGYVTPQMFGAKGDGKTDDTEAIQYALDFAYDNNIGIVYIPAGEYSINGIEYLEPGEYTIDKQKVVVTKPFEFPTNNRSDVFNCGLVIHSNTKLIMDKNAILRLQPNGHCKSCVLRCDYGATNIEITGGQIIGDRFSHKDNVPLQYTNGNTIYEKDGITPQYADGERGVGIYVGGNEGVKISDCVIKETWGDGIEVTTNEFFTSPSRDILIDNVTIDSARRSGISLVGVDGCTISNSTIKNSGDTNKNGKLYLGTPPQLAIDIEASAYNTPTNPNGCNYNNNVIVSKCNIINNAGAGIGCTTYGENVKDGETKHYGIKANNIVIDSCTAKGNGHVVNADGYAKNGLNFAGVSNLTITNCICEENVSAGASISRTSNFSFSNNICNKNANGLHLGDASSGVVNSCTFAENSSHGLNGCDCIESEVTITSCVSNINKGDGIRFFMVEAPSTDAEKEALYNKTLPLNIDGCTCKNNKGSGTTIYHRAKCTINDCKIKDNYSFGIEVGSLSHDAIINGCHIADNYNRSEWGCNLKCYGNANAKIVNNVVRCDPSLEKTSYALYIGNGSSYVTENTFVAGNDCRGFATNKDISKNVVANFSLGKNIKSDGTYA